MNALCRGGTRTIDVSSRSIVNPDRRVGDVCKSWTSSAARLLISWCIRRRALGVLTSRLTVAGSALSWPAPCLGRTPCVPVTHPPTQIKLLEVIKMADNSAERQCGLWSPDGRLLYLLLERDGFRDLYSSAHRSCAWSLRSVSPSSSSICTTRGGAGGRPPSAPPLSATRLSSIRWSRREVSGFSIPAGAPAAKTRPY